MLFLLAIKIDNMAATKAAPITPKIIVLLFKKIHLLSTALLDVLKSITKLKLEGGVGVNPPFSAGQMGLGGGFMLRA